MTPSDYQLNSAGIPYVYPEKRHLSRVCITIRVSTWYYHIALTDGFIRAFVNEIDIIYQEKEKYHGIYSYIELTYAMPQNGLQVNSDIYWDQDINPNGRQISRFY